MPGGGYQNLAVRVASGQEVSEISRYGSGRIESGRVGSGQEVFNSRGSGRVALTRYDL